LFCNSFNAFLKLGWNVRSPLIHRILAGPVFAMAILSYLFGSRGAIEVVARKVQ
jgi:hypothetical protein